MKMILYSSKLDDMICDFFLGSFSTAKVAIALGRNACGFEINKNAFDHHIKEVEKIKKGEWLSQIRTVPENKFQSVRGRISSEEKTSILKDYEHFKLSGLSKQECIERLSEKYRLGYWSILNVISDSPNPSISLF